MNKRDKIANRIFLISIALGTGASVICWGFSYWTATKYNVVGLDMLLMPLGFWMFALMIILFAKKRKEHIAAGQ